jgi:hypothetical protein
VANLKSGEMMLRLGITLLSLVVPPSQKAQIAPTEYQLDSIPVIDNAVIIGTHVARLDWAVRECGGRHHLDKVNAFGRGRQTAPGDYVGAYNKELIRLGLHARFRGKDETCRTLYRLYGPKGTSAIGAFDPTKNLSGESVTVGKWLRH